MPAKKFSGKNAIITGASSGIGSDIAREIAKRGYNVILVARRKDKLQKLKSEIETNYKVNVEAIVLDLTSASAADSLYKQTEGKGVEIEILVNNAGYAMFGDYKNMTWEDERKLYQLDLIVVAQLTRLFLKNMLARKNGYILNMASIMGAMPVPTFSSYAGAKAFVINYSKSLSYELRNTGVSLTVVAPGTTDSEFFKVSGQPVTFAEKITMMKPSYVARNAVNAMFKRKTFYVLDWRSLSAVVLMKFLPTRAAAWLAYFMMTFAPEKNKS